MNDVRDFEDHLDASWLGWAAGEWPDQLTVEHPVHGHITLKKGRYILDENSEVVWCEYVTRAYVPAITVTVDND